MIDLFWESGLFQVFCAFCIVVSVAVPLIIRKNITANAEKKKAGILQKMPSAKVHWPDLKTYTNYHPADKEDK